MLYCSSVYIPLKKNKKNKPIRPHRYPRKMTVQSHSSPVLLTTVFLLPPLLEIFVGGKWFP